LKEHSTSKVGGYFDARGICLRSGFHCAPSAHKKLGTGDEGAVRISIGWNNTKKEAVHFLSSLWNANKEIK
jgi:selenocysteine lyase/cysteine desulfurase